MRSRNLAVLAQSVNTSIRNAEPLPKGADLALLARLGFRVDWDGMRLHLRAEAHNDEYQATGTVARWFADVTRAAHGYFYPFDGGYEAFPIEKIEATEAHLRAKHQPQYDAEVEAIREAENQKVEAIARMTNEALVSAYRARF